MNMVIFFMHIIYIIYISLLFVFIFLIDGPPMLSSRPPIINSRLSQFKPTKPLTITCLTIGSRGDVQPYIALCKELQKQGHHCRIASHGEYQSWVENFGIEFKSIGGDPGQLMKLCIDNGFLSYYFIKNGYKFVSIFLSFFLAF